MIKIINELGSKIVVRSPVILILLRSCRTITITAVFQYFAKRWPIERHRISPRICPRKWTCQCKQASKQAGTMTAVILGSGVGYKHHIGTMTAVMLGSGGVQVRYRHSYFYEWQTDRQTDTLTDRQTSRQTNKQTDRQTDRPTDRQTYRQTLKIQKKMLCYRSEPPSNLSTQAMTWERSVLTICAHPK